MKIKLVGAKRYAHRAFPERVLEKGSVVTVPDAVGEKLLEGVMYDSLNNEHHYFEMVSDPDEDEAVAGEDDNGKGGELEPDDTPVSVKRASSSRIGKSSTKKAA